VKKITLFFIYFIACTAMAQVEPIDTDDNGYYNISNANHLLWLSQYNPNEPETLSNNYELDNNIDARNSQGEFLELEPIGSGGATFKGNFDGKGYTISGICFRDKDDETPVGFFGTLVSSAYIHDLHFKDCIYIGRSDVGIIAGKSNSATILNCSATGEVTGRNNVGGIIGNNNRGIISKCCSDVIVYGITNIGGLVGMNVEGNIDQCYATGKAEGEQYIGGLTGANTGTIENCYSYSWVDGIYHMGGFVAANTGLIEDCYSFGPIFSEKYTGGFVEENAGTVNKCIWDADASGYYTSAAGLAFNTADMKKRTSYYDLEWDFVDIWHIAPHINQGYPHLQSFVYKLNRPTLIYPENKIGGIDLTPTFDCADVVYATKYHIQVAYQEEFDSNTHILIDDFTDSSAYVPSERFPESLTLFWRMKAINNTDSSMWSEVWEFKSKDIIDPPELISPEDNELRVALNLTFLWLERLYAINYNLQVATDLAFDSLLIDTNITNTSFMPEFPLLESTRYYWKMTATDSNDVSFWSDIWEFTTKGPIDPPQLIAPADSSENLTLFPTLEWHSIEIAGSYNIEIASDIFFTNTIIEDNISDTTYTITKKLLEDSTYYWRVNAMNTKHASVWSETWQFRTTFVKVILSYPDNYTFNYSLDGALVWEKHKNPSICRYKIQISTSPEFTINTIIETAETLLDTTYSPQEMKINTTYWWRVQGVASKNNVGLWSDIWNYKTGIKRATLFYPEDLSTDINFTNQMIRWDKVAGADYYHLQMSYNEDFTNLALSVDSIITNKYRLECVTPQTTYYWRVKAWNSDGQYTVQWSEEWEFTTKTPQFYLDSPQDEATDIEIPVSLRWNTNPPNIPMFILQVSDTETFNEVLFQKNDIALNQYILRASDASELTADKTYYWRVAVKINHFTSDFSDVWSFTVSIVSVTDIAEEINIYPQPANEKIGIVISCLSSRISRYSIVDIEGKTILSKNLFLNNGDHNIIINTSAIVSGKYFLLLYSEKGILIQDLMIEK